MPPKLGGAIHPVRIGTAGDALGEVSVGTIHVARPEACFEKRVVKHVALRATPTQLDDATSDWLDSCDRPRPVTLGKSVQTFGKWNQDVPNESGAVLRRALTQHAELALGGRPVAAPRERHGEMRGVKQQALAIEALPCDGDEGAPAIADVV